MDFERAGGRDADADVEALLVTSESVELARSVVVKNLLRSSARVAGEAPWRGVPFTMVTLAVLGCSDREAG